MMSLQRPEPRGRYREMVDRLSDMVAVVDADGTVGDISPSVTSTTGLSRSDVVGRNLLELVHPAEEAELRVALQQGLVDAAGDGLIEFRLRDAQGEWRILEARAAGLVDDESSPRVIISARDVTESRAAARRYRDVLEDIDAVVWEWDVEKWQFTYVSSGAERLLGYPAHQWLDEPDLWERTIHPEDREETVETCARAAERGDAHTLEYRAVAADGRVVWLRDVVRVVRGEDGEPTRLRGVMLDVTERKAAEEALRRSRDFHLSLFDEFPTMVWRSDATGRCDYFNKLWLEFRGRTAAQEMDHRWTEGIHPQDRARFLGAFRAALRERAPFTMEYRLENQKGGFSPILCVCRPFFELDGTFGGYIGVGFDLGETRALETQLMQAQKMEAVGRLAGGIAHDFNNVLTAVIGHADFVLEALEPGDPVREDVEEVRRGGLRAANLTRQLLAFSRRQVLQPKVIDMNRLITDMGNMLGRLIGEHIELELQLMEGLPAVRADAGRIEQVIANLVVNARDAMPAGGRVLVRTTTSHFDEEFTGRYPYPVQQGEYVHVSVSDTGSGMDEATLQQVFEPFFTTKRVGEGTGLGLSTVYGIVKQSGGYIWAASEPDSGSRFDVYLPRVDEPVDAADDYVVAEHRGTETVLLVEDDAAVRALARRTLDRAGYEVIEAESGDIALQRAAAHRGSIDLLLTDVVMAGTGGKELATKLEAVRPDMKVVFMSGYTADLVVRQGLQGPGIFLLEKPFGPPALTAKVREALDTRRAAG